jgi:uncharacterized protein (TIGR00106 family)
VKREAKEGGVMVLLEFSMSPLGKGESVGAYVARSLDIIDKSGVPYRLNPMGTVLEGEWDEVFGVVKQCYERMKKDCNRISCTIKVDYRKGAAGRLESKVAFRQAVACLSGSPLLEARRPSASSGLNPRISRTGPL